MRLKLIVLSASVLALAACSSKHNDPYADAYGGGYDAYGNYGGQAGQMGYGGQAGYGQSGYGMNAGYGMQQGYGGGYTTPGCGGAMTPVETPCGGGMQAPAPDCGGGNMGGGAYGMNGGYGMGGGAYGGGQGGGAMAADCSVQMLYAPVTPVMYYAAPQQAQYGQYVKPDRMPWGIELGIGTDFDVSGDVFPGAPKHPGFTSEIDPISYKDAWKEAIHYDAALTYDLDHNTTVLGRLDYSKAKGRNNKIGTVTNGGLTEDLYAEFTDLEQITLEGGVRQYVSRDKHHVNGIRPYVAVTGGFTHTNDVDMIQSSATIIDPTLYTQQYVYSGWSPTAAGMVGAEWQMGGRKAILLETGLRWKDNLDANYPSDDRITVPVRLRGRFSF